VIIGGIKSIARVTEKVVPFMGVGYVGSPGS
jgi:alanine or glycine:cation symporter, AGCS family